MALEQHEANPKAWKAPLRSELIQTGADQDEQVIDLAAKLLTQLDPEGVQSGKYRLQLIGSVQGAVIGDHAQVIQTFGRPLDDEVP